MTSPPTAIRGDIVVADIEIAAPPERVFRALVDPGELGAWWQRASVGLTTRWTLEARRGGAWRAEGRDDACGPWMLHGRVVTFDPPRALAYTWNERIDPAYRESLPVETLVRYDLTATPAGTRVTVTHSGFPVPSAIRDGYANGWPEVLDLLAAHLDDLTRRDPTTRPPGAPDA